jgi:hypothetical protein
LVSDNLEPIWIKGGDGNLAGDRSTGRLRQSSPRIIDLSLGRRSLGEPGFVLGERRGTGWGQAKEEPAGDRSIGRLRRSSPRIIDLSLSRRSLGESGFALGERGRRDRLGLDGEKVFSPKKIRLDDGRRARLSGRQNAPKS